MNWGKPEIQKRISFSSIFFVSYLTQADLRHSHASLLIANHADIATIANRLGHEKITTTLNIYSHMFEANARKVADTINAGLDF